MAFSTLSWNRLIWFWIAEIARDRSGVVDDDHDEDDQQQAFPGLEPAQEPHGSRDGLRGRRR